MKAEPRAPGAMNWRSRTCARCTLPRIPPSPRRNTEWAFLMDWRHLWLRSPRQQAVLRVRDEVCRACRDFFPCAGLRSHRHPHPHPHLLRRHHHHPFETDYLDRGKAYLSRAASFIWRLRPWPWAGSIVSGLLSGREIEDPRHLTEFWMVEAEAAFYTLEEVMGWRKTWCAPWSGGCWKTRRPAPPVGAGHRAPQAGAGWSLSPGELRRRPGVPEGARQGSLLGGGPAAMRRPCCPRASTGRCWCIATPGGQKAFYMEPDPADPRLALCVDMLARKATGRSSGAPNAWTISTPCWPAWRP